MEKIVSGLLQDLARAAGKNQTQVAELSGINRQVVSTYFRGTRNPPDDKLKEIIKALGYTYSIERSGKEVVLRLKPTTEAG